MCPYDRFKFYAIIPTVRIELNSIQTVEVVPVVRVLLPYSHPNRLNIVWEDWGDHIENRLYRNQRQILIRHSLKVRTKKQKLRLRARTSYVKLAEMVASPIQSNNDEDEAALIAKLQALQVTEESLEKKKGLEDMNR